MLTYSFVLIISMPLVQYEKDATNLRIIVMAISMGMNLKVFRDIIESRLHYCTEFILMKLLGLIIVVISRRVFLGLR